MNTVLIVIVLLAIGIITYQVSVLQAAARAGECDWRVLFDPRPSAAPRRFRHVSLIIWLVTLLALGALFALWLQG